MLENLRQVQTGKSSLNAPLRVGLTYDTRDDFKFNSDNPNDWDAEFAVSVAIDDIAHAIEDLGNATVYIGSGRKLLDNFSSFRNQVDIVFNIAEGRFGRAREAQIPAMLELAGVPYVGSDSYALAIAANKWHTKVLAMNSGIRTPRYQVFHAVEESRNLSLDFPVIGKLCYEGSSMGLTEGSVVSTKSELEKLVRYLLRTYKQPILVEEFIEGREVDVPIIGTSPAAAFGVVGIALEDNIDLNERFLTSAIVRDDAYELVFPLHESYVDESQKAAVKLYNVLGCRDFGRVDFRISNDGFPYLLEINPYPFLGRHSSFNAIAERTIGYKQMIGLILESALKRQTIRTAS